MTAKRKDVDRRSIACVRLGRLAYGPAQHSNYSAWLGPMVVTVRRSALHGLCDRNSVCPSVCPSVHPSVTLVDCVHMVQPTVRISSPHGSPMILVSGDISFIPKFEGGHPERWRINEGGVGTNWRCSTLSRRISETVVIYGIQAVTACPSSKF